MKPRINLSEMVLFGPELLITFGGRMPVKIPKCSALFERIRVGMLTVISSQSEYSVEAWHSITKNYGKGKRVDFVLSDYDDKSLTCSAVNVEIDAAALITRSQLLGERIKPVRNWLGCSDRHSNN